MKVFAFYYMHKRGGFCGRLYRLLNALAERGHQVTYMSLDAPPDGSLRGVSWERIPLPLKQRAGLFFWMVFTCWLPLYLLWAIGKRRPHRILAFGAYYAAAVRCAAFIHGIPTVLFLRALTFRNDKALNKSRVVSALSWGWEKVGVWGATKIVAMTAAMREDVLATFKVPQEKLVVLANNVPVQQISELPPTRPWGRPIKLVTAGVLDARKNVRLIVDAVTSVNASLGRIEFLLEIVGDGPERLALERYVQNSHMEGIHFAGWKDSLREVLRDSDILIHAAVHEGMPNVVLEAWSESLPVLLADTPELSELAGAESTLLFPVGEPETLAARLLELSSTRRLQTDLIDTSRRAATRFIFDWDTQATDFVVQT